MVDNFEDRITRGLAQWITFVEVDEAAETVRIGLTHNPEIGATEKLITFAEVTKVDSDWFERDDDCMESVIGAHEDQIGEQMRYMFHSEQRELWIWARQIATIVETDQPGSRAGQTQTCPMCGASSQSGESHCATCGESLLGTEGEIYRDGKLLVMHKTAKLSYRCLKTNQAADLWLRRKFVWHAPWLYLLILFPGLLFYILIALIVQRRATIQIPLSREASRRRWRGIWTGWGLVLGGIALIFAAIAFQDGRARDFPAWFLIGGLLSIVVGAIVGVITSSIVSASRIEKEFVWIQGGHPDYLAQFPDWVKRF